MKEVAFLSSDFDEFKSGKGNKKGMKGYSMDYKYIYFWDDYKIWTCQIYQLNINYSMRKLGLTVDP